MAGVLRICSPTEYPYILEYRAGRFFGMWSEIAADTLAAITRSANITVEIRSQGDQVGENIDGSTGRFSGCIGRLQSNQSDAMLYLTNYPSEAANITQRLVMSESMTTFISVYYRGEGRMVLAQIEKSFSSYDGTVWLISTLLIILIIGLLLSQVLMKMKRWQLIGRNKPVQYKCIPLEVLAHMTNHGQLSDTRGSFRKIIFTTLSIFSFLVILFLCCFINTDLVIIPQPRTLQTYQQLLDAQCGILFPRGGDTYQQFKFAPETSEENKLWNLSVTNFPMGMIFLKTQEARNLPVAVAALAHRKLSIVTDSDWVGYFQRFFCSYLLNQQKLERVLSMMNVSMEEHGPLPLSARDKNARVSQKGFISKSLASEPIRRLEKVLRRVYEAGLPEKIRKMLHRIDTSAWLSVSEKGDETVGNMQKCIDNQLILPDYTIDSIHTGNLKNFPVYALVLISVQFITLISEVLVERTLRRSNVMMTAR